mgnify:FL=1
MQEGKIKLSISKLIALWAFSECALGGILHAFQFPFSGLLLAGFAVTIICTIGYTSDKPSQDIMYGTLVAIAVKLALSPHSPVTAYIAVGFQGVLGALFFKFQKHNKLYYILFGSIALFESAIQKVFTLTIIFGNALWNSIDTTANQLAKNLGGTEEFQYALLLLIVYSLIYVVWGGIVGSWAYKLPNRIEKLDRNAVDLYANSNIIYGEKKGRIFGILIIGLLLVTTIYVASLGGTNNDIFWTIVRPFIIITAWYFIFNPLIIFIIRRFINNQSSGILTVVDTIKEQIPHLRKITQQVAGYTTANYNGIERIRYFIIILILLACEEGEGT